MSTEALTETVPIPIKPSVLLHSHPLRLQVVSDQHCTLLSPRPAALPSDGGSDRASDERLFEPGALSIVDWSCWACRRTEPQRPAFTQQTGLPLWG
jgi:hypothetical protein